MGKIAFQSTPSAWRVTVYVDARDISSNISIHTLRMEGDHDPGRCNLFRPISIHTLRMEGDTGVNGSDIRTSISIHTLRMEGDYAAHQFFR